MKHFDTSTMAVLLITLVLFVAALFSKGLSHDLLLEAGVFLVSVKLILFGYKQSVLAEALKADLEEIKRRLAETKDAE